MQKHKIAIIGFGNIGSSISHFLSFDNRISIPTELAIYDTNFVSAQGKILDLQHALQINNVNNINLKLYNNIKDTISEADAIVITAGKRRTPEMKSRDELLYANSEIIQNIALEIKNTSPSAFVIIITNPLDLMLYKFIQSSGLSRNKAIGMSGLLDSSRFCNLLSQKIQNKKVEAMIIGPHNEDMCVAVNSIKIDSKNLKDLQNNNLEDNLIFDKEIQDALKETKEMGFKINEMMNTSAYIAPAKASVEMLLSYLYDKNLFITASFLLNGEFNIHQVPLSAPIIINKNGATFKNIDLRNDELLHLTKCAEKIQNSIKQHSHIF